MTWINCPAHGVQPRGATARRVQGTGNAPEPAWIAYELEPFSGIARRAPCRPSASPIHENEKGRQQQDRRSEGREQRERREQPEMVVHQET